MSETLYQRLIDGPGGGDPFDRHLFACAIVIALADAPPVPLARGLGLDCAALATLSSLYFPHLPALVTGPAAGQDAGGPLSPEEPDLRAFLLEFRRGALIEEEWLAHILARRAQGANHLWQDLGLRHRDDLGLLMRRHFPRLSERNDRDMKWKKFLYRELCQREGIFVCKSPNCEICTDHALCFGAEDGRPLG